MCENNEHFVQTDEERNELADEVTSKPIRVTCPNCNKEFDLSKAKNKCPHCGFIFLSTLVDIR